MPETRLCENCGRLFRCPPSAKDRNCSVSCRGAAGSKKAHYARLDAMLHLQAEAGETDDCIEWPGTRLDTGYGLVGNTRKNAGLITAHRLAYEMFVGPLTTGEMVCHRCDNPPCCNPRHLFPGTSKINMQDAVAKGRTLKGERHSMAKLTAADVIAIRSSDEKLTTLAARFGVDKAHVSALRHRKAWKHLP